MTPDTTVYRGHRRTGPKGEILGVVAIRYDGDRGQRLTLDASLKVWKHSPTGFEWGYGGSGPAQLALALVLDATGDRDLAAACYQWFKWAVVSQWGERWEITAGQVRRWIERWEREQQAHPERSCRVCGCTDRDCSQCVAATGVPCSWVAGEPDLCSRCVAEMCGKGVARG